MILKELFLFCLIFATVLAVRTLYENYPFYKITPITKEQLNISMNLEEASDSILFLQKPHKVRESLHIVVAPHKVPDFLNSLTENKISVELIHDNFQEYIDTLSFFSVAPSQSTYNWKYYFGLDKTYQFLKETTNKYEEQVTLINIGKTYEGRDILGVKISFKEGNPGIFLEAGIHAREWITPATATYILNELLTSNNSNIRQVAENYDWYIFPHLNPDGYVFSHSTDRMWKKTRSKNGVCYGSDPNRNFDVKWNTTETGRNPCSNTYAGSYAESEIEIKTFASYLKNISDKFDLYISFHAYSQLLLFSHNYTSKVSSKHKAMKNLAKVATDGLTKRYGTKYTYGEVYHNIYPVPGLSIDWVYDKLNKSLVFCYELRPKTGYYDRFMLSPSKIIATGQVTLDSIIALINKAAQLKYFNKKT